jgi:hypothetical protein
MAKCTNKECTMTHHLFGAIAVVAFASFAGATPGIAESDPALKLAMGPTSAPQKPGGTSEAPADTQPHKATRHKHRHS